MMKIIVVRSFKYGPIVLNERIIIRGRPGNWLMDRYVESPFEEETQIDAKTPVSDDRVERLQRNHESYVIP